MKGANFPPGTPGSWAKRAQGRSFRVCCLVGAVWCRCCAVGVSVAPGVGVELALYPASFCARGWGKRLLLLPRFLSQEPRCRLKPAWNKAATVLVAKKYRQKYRQKELCLVVEGLNRIVPGFCLCGACIPCIACIPCTRCPRIRSFMKNGKKL